MDLSTNQQKVGTIKKGNDGNMWIIMQASSGIKTWEKIVTHIDYKIYPTLDNGGLPFLVYVGSKDIYIYKIPEDSVIPYEKKRIDYYKYFILLVKSYKNIKKIFIGKDMTDIKCLDGNSIIIQLAKNKYVFIGHIIYEFNTPEEIDKYYSMVGNSHVPYPVALSKNYAYFMLDKVYVNKNEFSEYIYWADAYREFYGHTGNKKPKNLIKMKGIKIIHKEV